MKLTDDTMFFAGVMEDLLFMAADQDFTALLEYRRTPGSVEKVVECRISRGRYATMRLNLPSLPSPEEGSDGYVRFNLRGQLHYSAAGVVFGLLPLASYRPASEKDRGAG